MAAYDAQGCTLTIDDGTLSNAINIVGFKSYDGFGGSVTINDITTFASTAKEKRAGLADFGSFSAVCDDDPDDAGQQECLIARNSQATREFVFRNPATADSPAVNPKSDLVALFLMVSPRREKPLRALSVAVLAFLPVLAIVVLSFLLSPSVLVIEVPRAIT